MKGARLASFAAALALHSYVLWFWKTDDGDVPLAVGEQVDVELVEASAPEDAVETPPEPTPPDPEPVPPEPMPEPEPEPPPPPPDAIADPIPEPEPEPKPKPAPKPAPKPVAKPAPKVGPPPQASPAMAGSSGGAASGSAKGSSRAEFKYKAEPIYPVSLKRMKIQGKVEVTVVVSDSGRAVSARVSKPSGYAEFDQECIRAALRTTFEPKKVMGVAVQDTVRIPYNFVIR